MVVLVRRLTADLRVKFLQAGKVFLKAVETRKSADDLIRVMSILKSPEEKLNRPKTWRCHDVRDKLCLHFTLLDVNIVKETKDRKSFEQA